MSPQTPTLAAVIRTAIDNRLGDVHTCLPGRVEKYDAATQKADVQPLIQRFQEASDGTTIVETYPVISGVPVVFPRMGKYALTFPVARGDNVALVFCESSTEVYQIGGGRDPVSPDLLQRFDLTDAVAIPGWYPDGKSLAPTDADAIVIGEDGLPLDFVALAEKVKTEVEKVTTYLSIIDAIYNGAPIAEPGNGSPSALQAAIAIALVGSPVPTIAAPAAEKVKAT